jgi:hypothetical protein
MPSMKTPIAENADGSERQVKLGSTRARAGNWDRDVLAVLVISTVLAIVALIGAFAFFSGGLTGFGNQTRSAATFEQPNTPAPATNIP